MRIVLLALVCIFWSDVLLASNAKTVGGELSILHFIDSLMIRKIPDLMLTVKR